MGVQGLSVCDDSFHHRSTSAIECVCAHYLKLLYIETLLLIVLKLSWILSA